MDTTDMFRLVDSKKFQGDKEILEAAEDLLINQQFPELRNYILTHRECSQTASTQVQLVRLWEESLYQEYNASQTKGNPDITRRLTERTRCSLRRKAPCPIQLEYSPQFQEKRLPISVHGPLNRWLEEHISNPFPTKDEKEELGKKLGITPQQVNRWFIQRRRMIRLKGRLYMGRSIDSERRRKEEAYKDWRESQKGNEPWRPWQKVNVTDNTGRAVPGTEVTYATYCSMVDRQDHIPNHRHNPPLDLSKRECTDKDKPNAYSWDNKCLKQNGQGKYTPQYAEMVKERGNRAARLCRKRQKMRLEACHKEIQRLTRENQQLKNRWERLENSIQHSPHTIPKGSQGVDETPSEQEQMANAATILMDLANKQ